MPAPATPRQGLFFHSFADKKILFFCPTPKRHKPGLRPAKTRRHDPGRPYRKRKSGGQMPPCPTFFAISIDLAHDGRNRATGTTPPCFPADGMQEIDITFKAFVNNATGIRHRPDQIHTAEKHLVGIFRSPILYKRPCVIRKGFIKVRMLNRRHRHRQLQLMLPSLIKNGWIQIEPMHVMGIPKPSIGQCYGWRGFDGIFRHEARPCRHHHRQYGHSPPSLQ